MTDIIVGPVQTLTDPVVLDEPGDSLEVQGRVDVAGDDPAVVTQSVLNVVETVDVAPGPLVAIADTPLGSIRGENTAIRVEGTNSLIRNERTIDGAFNGIDVANGGVASASILNGEDGRITSESRAVNLGGDENTLVNQGLIVTDDDPRNGTVYGDITANTIDITNTSTGLIDVGAGNSGVAISLELGPLVRGSVVNSGEVLGRGDPESPDIVAAVRLYSGPDQPVVLPSTFIGDIVNEAGGLLSAGNGPAVVVEEDVTLNGSIINRGDIESPNGLNGVGIRFEAGSDLNGEIVNESSGIINGGRDGIDIGNGGDGSFVIRNEGLITSVSRAVNLGADENTLINDGTIVTSLSPRNGTVYGDILANQIDIFNLPSGLIDVGAGNDGDAISLELGPDVSGSVINEGLVQGRGLPGVVNPNNQASAVRLYSGPDQGTDQPSTFSGNIINEAGGRLFAENGPAVIIEEGVTVDGSILNRGTIDSPNVDNGTGVFFEAGSDLTGQLVNATSGVINGGRNGIDVGNGGDGSFEILNQGLITSDSRPVNLGADENTLINEGEIISSANPRNGTVYGDILANQIDIHNRADGVIDVGAGNNGDAISLELGPDVSGSIVNAGEIFGRGLPGVESPANFASAIRLYSGPDQGGDQPSTFTGDIVNEAGGVLSAENGPAVVIEEGVTVDGSILNRGTIESPDVDIGTGVLFVAGSNLTGQLLNETGGVINGGRNGIDVGNGGDGSFEILNQGLITSDSRPVNLGADENTLINEGEIISSDNPRNGTVYGDILANQIDIHNRADGVIDVGAGNDGDAISLELGPDVSGAIVNAGEILGRGLPGVESPANFASAIRLYSGPDQGGDQPSTFTGDIVNEESGVLSAENGPAIVVEENTTLNGQIINRGTIEGGATDSGDPLAIDGSEANGALNILNEGSIIGDVVLSDGDDRYEGTQPASHDGVVESGAGEDILLGTGDDDHFSSGDGDDLLSGRNGDDELNGGEGDDRLFGGGNNDLLNGDAGNDSLFGGNGSDTLDGGEGNDRLMGDAGPDTFVFAPGSGSDLVTDFELGLDLLDLTGFGFADFATVQAVSAQQGNSTVIDLDMTGGDNVTLAQIDLTDLTQDSFLL